MLIPTLIPPLLAEVEGVIAHPERHGIATPAGGKLALLDVLEALLPSPQWEWLTADDLESVLRQSERLRLQDDLVVTTQAQARGPSSGPAMERVVRELFLARPGTVLFLARPGSGAAAPVSRETPVRLYAKQDVAMIVAGARSGTFEDVRMWGVRTSRAVAEGARLEPLREGVFLGTGLEASMLEPMPVDLAAPWMDALRYRLKLAEALYLDDPGPQADASRALFQLRPQAVVEAELAAHLAREDRFVRINVLTALGLPAYTAGFVPGEPLPPREDRLEPVTLRPETVRAILTLARQERDAGVLSYVLCTLKAQTYTGRLRDVAPEVREVVRRDVLPRVDAPSVIQDAKELLGLLPPMS